MEYNLIQDFFNEFLVEDIRSNLTIFNEDGVSVRPSKILYDCTTWREFVNVVLPRIKENEKYPFIFMPSGDNIVYESSLKTDRGVKVKVDKTYLCTLSHIDLLSDERDKISFNQILIPLKQTLEKRLLKAFTRVIMPVNFDTFEFEQYHAFGVNAQSFENKLDVLVVKNMELTLIKDFCLT